jgi:transcriptional regulator with XRE-family HTH domain
MTQQELVAFRERLQLTQQELADRLGIDRVTIARWETGTRAIPVFLHLALETIERRATGRNRKRSGS